MKGLRRPSDRLISFINSIFILVLEQWFMSKMVVFSNLVCLVYQHFIIKGFYRISDSINFISMCFSFVRLPCLRTFTLAVFLFVLSLRGTRMVRNKWFLSSVRGETSTVIGISALTRMAIYLPTAVGRVVLLAMRTSLS